VRRLRAIPVAVALLAALALSAGAPARAAAVTLTVEAVPALQGLDFKFDGRHYTTSKQGIVRIPVAATGEHRLVALPWRHSDRGVKVAFARWGDDSFTPARTVTLVGSRVLQVGYGVNYLRGLTFYDCIGAEDNETRTGCADNETRPVKASEVKSVTLANMIGEKFVLARGERRWLEGVRVARRLHGLEETLISYSVMQVMVSGTNVVNQAQQRYYFARPADPRKTPYGRHLRFAASLLHVRLSLYDANFTTHDLLFRRPVGNAIQLTYPDGHKRRVALHGGRAVLKSLPRGLYDVVVKTRTGIQMKVPVSLSKNQNMQLKVISYADVGASFLVFALVAVGLVSARRPTLRAAVRQRIVKLVRGLRLLEAGR
jgi:hypothetical protein